MSENISIWKGVEYRFNTEVVKEEPLVNDEDVGYGWRITAKRVEGVPDNIQLSALSLLYHSTGDLWDQRRFHLE